MSSLLDQIQIQSSCNNNTRPLAGRLSSGHFPAFFFHIGPSGGNLGDRWIWDIIRTISYTLVPCPPRTLSRLGYKSTLHPLPRLLTRSSPWQLMSDRHLSGRESIHRLFPRREHQNRQARKVYTDGGGTFSESTARNPELASHKKKKKSGNPNSTGLPRNSSGPDHKAFASHMVFSFLFSP